jgi:hypothetical protein
VEGAPEGWTYGDFDLAVRRLESGICASGQRPGDCHVMCLPNSAAFPPIFRALQHLSPASGGRRRADHRRHAEDQLRDVVEHSQGRGICTQTSWSAKALAASDGRPFDKLSQTSIGKVPKGLLCEWG